MFSACDLLLSATQEDEKFPEYHVDFWKGETPNGTTGYLGNLSYLALRKAKATGRKIYYYHL